MLRARLSSSSIACKTTLIGFLEELQPNIILKISHWWKNQTRGRATHVSIIYPKSSIYLMLLFRAEGSEAESENPCFMSVTHL
ncbi:uncharacterized protein PHALS_14553 [Plasmopara halstedii]|uniref:Uncharacterized protein n=1 Tax=Plasmopara halstedii TaxID=4781 RepID=A0A0P1ALS7_PLAHL|nr:uncharacterized protein PHALS_14553 [Plasmopara halstedii]CEG41688.1 hypothetical protein PHALS_14553 [Plasmopara halstedii]|eukprot:XP_024578057.1 hypothetical protein PHALS_14553 [Plasmopara halstedii]